MSKVVKKKQQTNTYGYRLRNLALSILATPLNLLAIAARIMWSTRRLRLASLALVVALAVTAVFRITSLQPAADYLLSSAHDISRDAGFRVDDITVEGRQRTQRADLVSAIQVDSHTPIFALDLDAIHHRVRALPWVGDVAVIRRLPNILHISLNERQPFALFRDGDSVALIDRDGTHITGNHLKKFTHLPVFSGQGAGLRAASLMDTLEDYPVVRNRLVAAHWTGERRWTLQLDHGGAVHLPDNNLTGALNRLMDLEREQRILAEENQAIDLRLPDRILLRPRNNRSNRSSHSGHTTASHMREAS